MRCSSSAFFTDSLKVDVAPATQAIAATMRNKTKSSFRYFIARLEKSSTPKAQTADPRKSINDGVIVEPLLVAIHLYNLPSYIDHLGKYTS
jgi:hypothetical protein